MEVYQTEEQQVEAIKSFWKENGNAILAGLAVGFAGFIGFNYYKEHKLTTEITASDTYQAIIDTKTADEQKFLKDGESFIAANSESSYAALTALALAKEAATHQDWPQVASYLETAIKNAPTPSIKGIATIRLARVQIQQAQYDEALATVSAELPVSFKASIEEVKGDAYFKQGKKELARNAYQAAIDADGLTTNPMLQVKLDDLAEAVILSK